MRNSASSPTRAHRSRISRSSSGSSSSRRNSRRRSTRSAVSCSPLPGASRRAGNSSAIRAASSSRCSRPTRAGSSACGSTFRRKRATAAPVQRRPKTRRLDGTVPRALASPLEGERHMLSKAGSPLERLATWVAGLSGWRRALFTVVLGVLSVLAFAPFHLWPVLFFTLGPLVWLLDGCHRDHDPLAARLKCASLSGLYWVAEAFLVEPWRHGWLIPLVMTALPAGMALFLSAAAALAMLLWR